MHHLQIVKPQQREEHNYRHRADYNNDCINDDLTNWIIEHPECSYQTQRM